MSPVPMMHTRRLTLRPLVADDAPRIEELAGDRRVAATTLHIPHPYPPGAAAPFIEAMNRSNEQRTGAVCAVTLDAESGALIGVVGLKVEPAHRHAELGYWIGHPYWNRGYGTEAARRLTEHGFVELNLHRIFAHHMQENPASGRVLEKIGMKLEGTLTDHVVRDGQFKTIVHYGVLADDFTPVVGD